MPADEYHSLLETVHLLRSPANAERLRASIAAARAAQVQEHELLEPDSPSAPPNLPSA